MPISLREPTALICPNCGGHFQAAVWLLLDAQEQPEQVAALRQHTLNRVTCPDCGHTALAAAPLLFHDSATRCVIFAPAPGVAEHVWRDQARDLHAMLVQNLPAEQQQPYLSDVHIAQDLPGIAHILTKLVRRHTQNAVSTPDTRRSQSASVSHNRLMVPSGAAAPSPVEASVPDNTVETSAQIALSAFLSANTPAELQTVIARHPILLQPTIDPFIARLADVAVEQRDYDLAEGLLQARRFLADLHHNKDVATITPDTTFPRTDTVMDTTTTAGTTSPSLPTDAYQAFLRADSAAALRQAIHTYPILLEPWVNDILLRTIDHALDAGNDRLAHDLEQLRELLAEFVQQQHEMNGAIYA